MILEILLKNMQKACGPTRGNLFDVRCIPYGRINGPGLKFHGDSNEKTGER